MAVGLRRTGDRMLSCAAPVVIGGLAFDLGVTDAQIESETGIRRHCTSLGYPATVGVRPSRVGQG